MLDAIVTWLFFRVVQLAALLHCSPWAALAYLFAIVVGVDSLASVWAFLKGD